jgi:bifunctional non-homologous end joining protein LigD
MSATKTREHIPFRVRPMLATLVAKAFHRAGWVYEEKYDGERMLAYKEGATVRLLSRNAKDHTAAFAEITAAIAGLPARTLLFDGEVIVLDRHGVSRFQLLQRGASKPIYAVFDCLYKDGRDLRSDPLTTRHGVLVSVLGTTGLLFVARRLAENGLDAYRIAKQRGYEGVVGKDSSAPYIEGRSAKWLKVKVRQEEEFVIAGYTAPSGSRKYFGALLLGGYLDGQLHYVGKVGTGFSEPVLAALFKKFRPLVQPKPSLVDPPRENHVTYLAPRRVAQIAFQEWTREGKLRQPVFLGLRDDKDPRECLLPKEWPQL